MLDFLVVASFTAADWRRKDHDAPRQGRDRRPDDRGRSGRRDSRAHARLRHKAWPYAAAVALFFTGLPLELVALGAAAVLAAGPDQTREGYREVDWSLLVMFTGLFIVVHAFQVHVVADGASTVGWLLSRPVDLLSLVSAGLSNLVSNVPAVLLLEPVVQACRRHRETAWLALAMSSTFAGNLTCWVRSPT